MTNKAIESALRPTREEIVEGITETLEARAENAVNKIRENDGDLRLAFPINYNSYSVDRQKADRAFALQVVADKVETSPIYKRNAPIPVTLKDALKVSEIIDAMANRHADDLLKTYEAKLTAKSFEHAKKKGLGESEIKSARYVGGRNPWQSSTIEVKFENGAAVTLTTSIIVNVSKHGKLFNQFPTRLKGHVAPKTEAPAPVEEKVEEKAPEVAPVEIPAPSADSGFVLLAKTWDAFLKSSAGNGHDFGILEEVRDELARRKIFRPIFDRIVADLVREGVIGVYDAVSTDSGRWTQFVIYHLSESES